MTERELLNYLEILTGTGLAGQFACQFAKRAQLDRLGALFGATIIAGYGGSLREMLPLAAHLAEDRGKPLPETAAVVSQAASGSASGFDRLREEYAVTSADLARHGAALSSPEPGTGPGEPALALCCFADIEANRNALIRLVASRSGGDL